MNNFEGFKRQQENWSKLPHEFIDLLPTFSSLAEIKVVLYILRHTWGYGDDIKRISTDEFENGRKRANGTRLDSGVGMQPQAIRDGLLRAEQHGFINVIVDESDKARIKKTYSIRFETGENHYQGGENHTSQTGENHLSGDGKSPISNVKITHRTKKETKERNPKKEKTDTERKRSDAQIQNDLLVESLKKAWGVSTIAPKDYGVFVKVAKSLHTSISPEQWGNYVSWVKSQAQAQRWTATITSLTGAGRMTEYLNKNTPTQAVITNPLTVEEMEEADRLLAERKLQHETV